MGNDGWEEYQDPMDAAGLGQYYYKAPECKYRKSLKHSTQKDGSSVAEVPCVTHEEICKKPVPAGSVGSCDYYCKRYANYRDRHDDKHKGSCRAPDYYLEYGYKYCSRFRNVTYYQLTSRGKIWLTDTLSDLQEYMEKGVVEKAYISKTNMKFNSRARKKGSLRIFYTVIECRNSDFRYFAFATHPDAYRPKAMQGLPVEDLITIATTPDLGEWVGRGSGKTWEQLGIMLDHMSVKTIAKNTVKRVGHAAAEEVEELYDDIKGLFK